MHPLGELERSPRPVTTIGKRVILLRERERRGEEGRGNKTSSNEPEMCCN